MKRLCLVAKNIEMAKRLVQHLEHEGVQSSHVHVLGKHVEEITEDEHLRNASIFQTTNILSALKAGLVLSLALIALIFCVFYFSMPQGIHFTTKTILAVIVAGFAFGLWSSSMIGLGVPSKVVDKTKKLVEEGNFIVMADIPKERVQAMKEHLKEAFPEIQYAMPVEEAGSLSDLTQS